MRPSERKERLLRLANRLRRMAARLEALAEVEHVGVDHLHHLAALNEMADDVEKAREAFADLKGVYATETKRTRTHGQIAELLSVSKPYVQQMVYRGRKL